MSRILIVDDDRAIRELLVDTLSDSGYDVIEARDGGEGLEKARRERPDLILLDAWMPVMDGLQMLEKLKEDPATQAIPVVMLTALPVVEGEHDAMKLGVTHYLTKPWTSDDLELTVKVALREAQAVASGFGHNSPKISHGSIPPNPTSGSQSRSRAFIGTGERLKPLEKKLDGGLQVGSLTLIEGASTTGKSVLCQHLAYGALLEDHGVAYFSSEHTDGSLVSQMSSIGLPVSRYGQADKLCFYPLQGAAPDKDSGAMLAALALDTGRLSPVHDFIVLDAISHLIGSSQEQAIIGFFSSCKQSCDKGRTIIVVVDSYALSENMRLRLRTVCDAYLRLRVEKVTTRLMTKLVRVVEIIKANNVELSRDNLVSFQVVPGAGIQIIAFAQAKV